MNEALIGYYLIQGLPISYGSINIYQPKLEDINNLKFNLSEFEQYKFCYIARKEYLELTERDNIICKDKSYFETLFLMENKTMIVYLLMSLVFFLKIQEERLKPNFEIKSIDILDENMEKIMFTINDNNFDFISKLIMLVCKAEKLPIPTNEPKYKTVKYKNAEIQAKFESMLKNMEEQEKKEEENNRLYFADILGMVANSNYSKYDLFTINKLTVWQIYYIYDNIFGIESNDITKKQFCSGQFQFKKDPNLLAWIQKSKIRLPKDMKEDC